jgi:hypothetical protein
VGVAPQHCSCWCVYIIQQILWVTRPPIDGLQALRPLRTAEWAACGCSWAARTVLQPQLDTSATNVPRYTSSPGGWVWNVSASYL